MFVTLIDYYQQIFKIVGGFSGGATGSLLRFTHGVDVSKKNFLDLISNIRTPTPPPTAHQHTPVTVTHTHTQKHTHTHTHTHTNTHILSKG
jgi:hypothetical protein